MSTRSSDGSTREQAALRRVATLVARAAAPQEVFAAVAMETGRLLGGDHTTMSRYGPDGVIRMVAAWNSTGDTFTVGARWHVGGRNLHTLVFRTGRTARIDDYAEATGPSADIARRIGIRAAVAVPVSVEGHLWGVMIVESRGAPLPAGSEDRLAGFTELAAIAIANAQARMELRAFAEEQAALRRVATLVAQAAAPEKVLATVAEEAGRLLHAHHAVMARYDPDSARTVVASWSTIGAVIPVGSRGRLCGRNVPTLVFQTGRAARIDDYTGASGPIAEAGRGFGVRAAVGVPVNVEGHLWGVMIVESCGAPLPAGTEDRLAGFTELAATAIANAEAQAALTASRARIVAAADAARRRFERDLHDGAQQRLVSLALQLRKAQAAMPDGAGELEGAVTEVAGVLEELRDIANGLHPAVLAERGLPAALTTLARRSAVPVRLDVQVTGRLPEQIEMAAYYVVAEALTNIAKHADATLAEIEVAAGEDVLRIRVRDDGCGGADFGRGSGLVGLNDRAEALGGRLWLYSPPGAGTTLRAELPVRQARRSGADGTGTGAAPMSGAP